VRPIDLVSVPDEVLRLWDRGLRRRGMYRDTVASETLKPSMRNSPWMRGAPRVGFSRAMRTTSARISASIGARPPRYRLFQVASPTPRMETPTIARSTRF
jgi:hypothetical protein